MNRPARNVPAETRDAFAKVLRHYACAWCGVTTRVEVLESIDGDRVCPGCADEEHAARERADEQYDGPVHVVEEWR
jgi:hypothetical protein